MSAILFIRRIFIVHRVRYITLSLLVLSILYGIVVLLEVFLICHPMAVDWNADIHGTCGNQVVSYVVLEILGLLLDSAIVAAPILEIWTLQIARAKMIRISISFSVGVL